MNITKRKESEGLNLENIQRFTSAFEFAPIGMALVSPEGNWLKVNKSLCDMFGYSEEELLSINFQTITYPEDLKRDLNFVNQMLKGEIKTYSMEKRYIRKDEKVIYTSLHVSLVYDKNLLPLYFISQIIDITDNVFVKNKIIQKEEELKSIFISLNDIIFLFSQDYRFLEVWTKNQNNLFLNPETFLGKTIRETLGDNFANPIEKLIDKVIKTKDSATYEYSSPDRKKHFLARLHYLQTKDEIEPKVSCMVIDITERKELEENLKASETKYKLLLNTLQEGVWVIDENNSTTFINPRLEEMLGYTQKEMLGKHLFDFMDEKGIEISKRNVERRKSGIKEQHEFELIHKNGNRIYTLMEAAPLYNVEGNYMGAIAGILDITERKLNEEKISHLLSEKEIILKEVHHRIKNNINNVIGFLEIGVNELTDESSINVIRETQGRVMSMMQLYDKLYRSSDYENLSAKDYLESLTDEIVKSFPHDQFLEVKKSFQEITINSKILSGIGILTNEILTNSMKYAFTKNEKGIIEISTFFKDNTGYLNIKDDGRGLPDLVNFEKSTGFGFSLIQMMVKQLKGKIQIDRSNGTSFHIHFPI